MATLWQIYIIIIPGESSLGTPERRVDDFANLTILRVSKRANQEVLEALRRKSWFQYDLRRREAIDDVPNKPHLKEIEARLREDKQVYRARTRAPTQHMMHVKLLLGGNHGQPENPHFNLVPEDLTGNKVLRRCCFVVFKSYPAYNTLCEPFFEQLRLLTGFATVEFQLTFYSAEKLEVSMTREKFIRECTIFMEDVEGLLKSALGPAYPGYACLKSPTFVTSIKFHPQQFLTKQVHNGESKDDAKEAEG